MAVPLASCTGVAIPPYFAKALDRVILVRKSFAEKLTLHGIKVNIQSEKSHSYFVEVLEKVRQALKPLWKDTGTKAKPASESSGALFHNLFSTLEVYQTSEKFDNAPDVPPPPPSQTKYVAEPSNSIADIVFAVTALLDDYGQLRNEINELWVDYAMGRLDLSAVSVATNMSFELARSVEANLEPLLKEVGGMHPFVDTYFRSLSSAMGISPLDKEEPGDPYNLVAYDLADMCFANTLTLVASFAASLDFNSLSLQEYNGKFGLYDETLGRSSLSNRQKWKQDMTAVLELMADLSFLVTKLGSLSVMDEITRGLAYIADEKQKCCPLWLAFAVQVYLDILHTYGQTCDGLGTMQTESRRIRYLMLKVPAAQSSQVIRATSLLDDDPIWAARKVAVEVGLLPQIRTAPFTFLKRNPMYCGLLIQNMRATVQNEGLPYAATPGALVGVVQLYHALRNEGLIDEDCV